MSFQNFVISTLPEHLSEDVPTDVEVLVRFTVDIDPRTLTSSTFYITTSSGVLVPAKEITYENRVARLVFDQPLKPGSSYVGHVRGSSDGETPDGIIDILGRPLIGHYSWRFKTGATNSLPAPELIAPASSSLIEDDRPLFRWSKVEGAESYLIEVSGSQNFFHIIWRTETTSTEVIPDLRLKDGVYYWRVTSLGGGRESAPSEIFVFTVQIPEAVDEPWGPEEDDLYLPETPQTSPVELVRPRGNLIKASTARLTFRVPARPEEIDPESITLEGTAFFDDPSLEDHGLVDIEIESITPDGPSHSLLTIRILDPSKDVHEEI